MAVEKTAKKVSGSEIRHKYDNGGRPVTYRNHYSTADSDKGIFNFVCRDSVGPPLAGSHVSVTPDRGPTPHDALMQLTAKCGGMH